MDRTDKAIIVQDSKLVHRLLPIPGCPSPIGGDIAQGQPDQLACRVITRECPRVLMILRSRALVLSMALVV